jgi:L,D-transpeptidase ErfK/SrfK
VDVWLPGEGTSVRLPTQFVLPRAQRRGVVINIAEYRMYYFFADGNQTVVNTFPISIGRMDWATPLGRAAIVNKVTDPSWYPPQSIRNEWAADGRQLAERVPPGPDNPLGRFAMRLSIPGYLIHGTNRPAGVGMRVTHGCIRMFPEDIAFLFPNVPVDTPVQIVNQPYKFGWHGDELYLEVHPPLETAKQATIGIEDPNDTDPWSLTSVTQLYIRVTQDRAANVDWQLIDRVYEERLGIPVKVGTARVPTVAAN